MKKILTTTILIALFSHSYAQSLFDAHSAIPGKKNVTLEIPGYYINDRMARSNLKPKSVYHQKNGSAFDIPDDFQKLDSISYTVDGASFPDVTDRFYYNDAGQITDILYLGLESGQWVTNGKELYWYNADGNLSTRFVFAENTMEEQLDTIWKFEYTYNENDLLFSETYSAKFENEWVKFWREEYYYSDSEKPDSTKLFSTDFPGGDLILSGKDIFLYNVTGKILTDDYFYLDAGEWIPGAKSTWTYNSDNKLVSVVNLSEGGEQGILINFSKIDLTYNENNNPTSETHSFWDNNEWVFFYKFEFTYSTDLTLENLYLPFDDLTSEIYYENGKMLTLSNFDWEGDAWVLYDVSDLHYSGFVAVGIEENQTPVFKMYPNPVNDYLFIESPETNNLSELNYSIFDINGRVIDQQQMPGDGKLYLANFKSGIYFLVILENNQGIFSRKIIKQ